MRKPLTLFADDGPPITTSLADIVTSSGRRLKPTVAFTSYWYLAAERQAMLFRRLRGDVILTHDAILRNHRFTNAYRVADRVSQFLICSIIGNSEEDPDDIVFRVLLFKVFNKIETWQTLESLLGESIHWATFSLSCYTTALGSMIADKQPIYNNAYMMPMPNLGYRLKHENHLALLDQLITNGLAHQITTAATLATVYEILRKIPSFGPFLAFQYTIDLNYTSLINFEEADFVVAGPGAIDGIRKCFTSVDGYDNADVIKIMVDIANKQFSLAEIDFVTLWGRPLQLIDCQNLFCEVDKYSRIAHPQLSEENGRSRIKQRYTMSKGVLPTYVFPHRWNIDATRPYGDVSRLSF